MNKFLTDTFNGSETLTAMFGAKGGASQDIETALTTEKVDNSAARPGTREYTHRKLNELKENRSARTKRLHAQVNPPRRGLHDKDS